jgi:bifunctional DNA primase/polymerase-like protein
MARKSERQKPIRKRPVKRKKESQSKNERKAKGLSAKGRRAVKYAKRGLPIFPLEPDGTDPLVDTGAESSVSQAKRWWKKWPNANIGVLLGSTVFAIEYREDHDQWPLPPHHLSLPLYYEATGPDGVRYQLLKASSRIPAGETRLAPGVYVLGKGKIIALPPSRIEGAKLRTSWGNIRDAIKHHAPNWCIKELKDITRAKDKNKRPRKLVASQRRKYISIKAARLQRGDRSVRSVTEALMLENEKICVPPLRQKTIKRIIELASRFEIDEYTGNPVIYISDWYSKNLMEQSIFLLRSSDDPHRIFSRFGKLVRVTIDERGVFAVQPLTKEALRGRLGIIADWIKSSSRDRQSTQPPDKLVLDILAMANIAHKFPPLKCVATAPFLRPDGKVVRKPGYDSKSKVFLVDIGTRISAIPGIPSEDELHQAVERILEVFKDFPLEGKSSRANTVALLLTLVLRPGFSGSAPMALIDAPIPGAGKGLLMDAISIIATGCHAPMVTPPENEKGWQGLINGVLQNGTNLVCIDNVEETINSRTLSSVLTSANVQSQVDGRSDIMSLRQQTCFVALGNNLRVSEDFLRRVFLIRIVPNSSRAWKRKKFEHELLLDWLKPQREEILSSLMTMAKAWHAAGCPVEDLPVMGGFESWVQIIGGVLKFSGIEGFLGNNNGMQARMDETSEQWTLFLESLYEPELTGQEVRVPWREPFTVNGLKKQLESSSISLVVLPDELLDALSAKSPSRAIGKAFSRRLDRRFGKHKLYIAKAPHKHHNAVLWVIRAGRKPSHGMKKENE